MKTKIQSTLSKELYDFERHSIPFKEFSKFGKELNSEATLDEKKDIMTLQSYARSKSLNKITEKNTVIAVMGKYLFGPIFMLPPFNLARQITPNEFHAGKSQNAVIPRSGLFLQAISVGDTNPPFRHSLIDSNVQLNSVEAIIEIPIKVPASPLPRVVEIAINCKAPEQNSILKSDNSYVGLKGAMVMQIRDTRSLSNQNLEFISYLDDYKANGVTQINHLNSFTVSKSIFLFGGEDSFTLRLSSFLTALIENYNVGTAQEAAIGFTRNQVFEDMPSYGPIRLESIEISFHATKLMGL